MLEQREHGYNLPRPAIDHLKILSGGDKDKERPTRITVRQSIEEYDYPNEEELKPQFELVDQFGVDFDTYIDELETYIVANGLNEQPKHEDIDTPQKLTEEQRRRELLIAPMLQKEQALFAKLSHVKDAKVWSYVKGLVLSDFSNKRSQHVVDGANTYREGDYHTGDRMSYSAVRWADEVSRLLIAADVTFDEPEDLMGLLETRISSHKTDASREENLVDNKLPEKLIPLLGEKALPLMLEPHYADAYKLLDYPAEQLAAMLEKAGKDAAVRELLSFMRTPAIMNGDHKYTDETGSILQRHLGEVLHLLEEDEYEVSSDGTFEAYGNTYIVYDDHVTAVKRVRRISTRQFAADEDGVLTRQALIGQLDQYSSSESLYFSTIKNPKYWSELLFTEQPDLIEEYTAYFLQYARLDMLTEAKIYLENLPQRESAMFVHYYHSATPDERKQLAHIIQEHGSNGLRTFLATREQGPTTAAADQLFAVASFEGDPFEQEDEGAAAMKLDMLDRLCQKFTSILNEVAGLEEYVSSFSREKADVLPLARVGKKIMEKSYAYIEAFSYPEDVLSTEALNEVEVSLQGLEAEAIIFASTFRSMYEEYGSIDIEKVDSIEHRRKHVWELTDQEKDQLAEVQQENWVGEGDLGQQMIEEFSNALNGKEHDTVFDIIKLDGNVIAFVRFDVSDPEDEEKILHAKSMNISKKYQSSAICNVMFEQSLKHAEAQGEAIKGSVLTDAKVGMSYVERNKFVITKAKTLFSRQVYMIRRDSAANAEYQTKDTKAYSQEVLMKMHDCGENICQDGNIIIANLGENAVPMLTPYFDDGYVCVRYFADPDSDGRYYVLEPSVQV